jgi:hypothetical protein
MPKRTRRQKLKADTRRNTTPVISPLKPVIQNVSRISPPAMQRSAYTYNKSQSIREDNAETDVFGDFEPIKRDIFKTAVIAICVLVLEIGLVIRFGN